MSRNASRVTLTVGALAGALALAGCSAGQITQTGTQVSAVGGASANIGQIAVRGLEFTFSGDGKSAAIYPSGGSAPLTMTVANFGARPDKLTAVSSPVAGSVKIVGDGTISAGKILVVEAAPAPEPTPEAASSSPALAGNTAKPLAGATTAEITPSAAPAAPATSQAPSTALGLQTATVAANATGSPVATATPSAEGTTTAQVVLTGLKQDIKAGLTYPVVLTFQNAGDVTVQVPVGNPKENGGG